MANSINKSVPVWALVWTTDTQTLTNKNINWVTLTAVGSSTQFLNAAWSYTTPAGWWGTWITIFDWYVAWVLVVWDIFEIATPWAFTLNELRISTKTLPTWANITVTIYKNWVADWVATIATTATATNWLYQATQTVFTSWSYVATDRVTVSITQVWSTLPWTNLSRTLS